ncbi:ead/Ea22-like family protein [Enterobacter roggenkampii]|uniref:ead/Ea22-like family protein n=1 Tax=Enterobacter roggenkampii TaxID=1812935 RepID=UPI003B8449E2
MSNIDKRALREAAKAVGKNDWQYVYTRDLSAPGRGYITVGGAEAIYCLNKATGGVKQSENVLRYIAAANPATFLALLDELEAENRISSTWRKTAESNREKLEAAERRIAELEARTLVPVEPTLDQLVAGKRRLTSTGRMSRLMSQRLAEVYRAMVSAAAAGKGEAL